MTGSPSRIPPRPRLRRLCRPEDSAGPCAAAVAPERPAVAARLVHSLKVSCTFLGLALAGCAETGDFGRPKSSLWNDVVLPATGSLAAEARGEPVSRYIHTDDEDELRHRAWRFIMPAHERSWFEAIIANLVRTRVLPLELQPADRTAYHHALMGGPLRSPASRYRRLSEDAFADAKLIAPFAVIASRVIAADAARLRSLAHVRDLDEAQIYHAVARVAENRCLIAWVRHETLVRLESYRYALEHLFIEAPQNEGIAAERSLVKLAVHRQTLDALIGPPVPEVLCASAGDVFPLDSMVAVAPAYRPIVTKD
jgi:hypothetical protein